MWRWIGLGLFMGFWITVAEAGTMVPLASPKWSKVLDVATTSDGVVASVGFSQSLSIGNQAWNAEGKGHVLVNVSSEGHVRWVQPTPMKVEFVSSGRGVIYVGGRGPISERFLGCGTETSKAYGAFVAQLDTTGQCRWIQVLESDSLVTIRDIASHETFGVVVVGGADANIRLGKATHAVTRPRTMFALRLSHNSDLNWMRIGTPENGALVGAWGKGVSMGPNGMSAIIGDFSGRMNWLEQRLESGEYVFKEGAVPKGASFVSVVTAKGDVLWSRAVSTRTVAEDIRISHDGMVYAMGNLHGDVIEPGDGFGPEHSFKQGASEEGQIPTMWLAKWQANGELAWMRTLTSQDSGQGVGLALHDDALVLMGFARGQIGNSTNQLELTNGGRPDVFLARYRLDGELIALEGFGGTGKDYASAIDSVGGAVVIAMKIQGAVKVGGRTVSVPSGAKSNGLLWIP